MMLPWLSAIMVGNIAWVIWTNPFTLVSIIISQSLVLATSAVSILKLSRHCLPAHQFSLNFVVSF